jgi:hypothetical protein
MITNFLKSVDYTFNFWDNLIALLSLVVSGLITILIYKLSKKLNVRDEYEHERRIINQIEKLGIYRSVILADVKKYKPFRTDNTNCSYYKQKVELYTCIPEYGVQVILSPSDERIPVALIPFDWIEIIRQNDSEDNKPIIVCKFKGVKWFKNFKAPFKEIKYMYKNSNYREGVDHKSQEFISCEPE